MSNPPLNEPYSLADWMGFGASLMSYGATYDPAEPALPADDWDAFRD